jgi:predicted HTH domain antitoxin
LQLYIYVNRKVRTLQRTVATRIPKELEGEIRRFMEEEGLDRSAAIRRILEIGVSEWKRRRTVELYRSGRVTLWRSAQIAGLSLREMIEELYRLKAITHVSVEDLEEDLEAAKRDAKTVG